jgi:DNA-binding MarR family transcriptional regulator
MNRTTRTHADPDLGVLAARLHLGIQRDLARLAGRNKQTIAAIVDELEHLGYLHRTDDPADRRAKLIVPTPKGRRRIRAGDQIIASIEERHQAQLGPAAYTALKHALRAITTDRADQQHPGT